MYEVCSAEMSKQLQNLNKNLSAGLNLTSNLLDSPRRKVSSVQYPNTIHGPNDSLVQSQVQSPLHPQVVQGRKKSNSTPTVSPLNPQQERKRSNSTPAVPLDKIKEYDTISQSSSVKSSDSEGKEKRKKRRSKKRTAKVQPKEQVDGVQDGDNKWANTPPGPPVAANAQMLPAASSPSRDANHQNSVNDEAELNKTDEKKPRLKKCSVSMDQLLYMNNMLEDDTEINSHSERSSLQSFPIHAPNLPAVCDENEHIECTQPVSTTDGIGTSPEVPIGEVSPIVVAHTSGSPIDVQSPHSGLDSQNKPPLASMVNIPTDDTNGAPIGNIPTGDTNVLASKSTRVKAKMSVSVDHFLYMDNVTNSPESNLKTQGILSSISEDEPKEHTSIPPNSDEIVANTSAVTPNTPDLDGKSPNCTNKVPSLDQLNLAVINKAEGEIEHSNTTDSRPINPFSTGRTLIPSDSSSQILMANFTTKSSISVKFEQTNSSDLPVPKTPEVTLPSENSSDEAIDDRQVLIGYRKNKRRPRRMDMSVEEFLKSVDKL